MKEGKDESTQRALPGACVIVVVGGGVVFVLLGFGVSNVSRSSDRY